MRIYCVPFQNWNFNMLALFSLLVVMDSRTFSVFGWTSIRIISLFFFYINMKHSVGEINLSLNLGGCLLQCPRHIALRSTSENPSWL